MAINTWELVNESTSTVGRTVSRDNSTKWLLGTLSALLQLLFSEQSVKLCTLSTSTPHLYPISPCYCNMKFVCVCVCVAFNVRWFILSKNDSHDCMYCSIQFIVSKGISDDMIVYSIY